MVATFGQADRDFSAQAWLYEKGKRRKSYGKRQILWNKGWKFRHGDFPAAAAPAF